MHPGLQFTAGLFGLVAGAELLVRGASGIAARMGISPLIVGLTVVALGTSTPELAASLRATLTGQPDIAIGNVVGSNIINILLVLGISALILPLAVQVRLIRIDVPLMVLSSLFFLAFAWDGVIRFGEGLFFVIALATYLAWTLKQAASEPAGAMAEFEREFAKSPMPLGRGIVLIAVGLVLLVAGSDWLVAAATDLARSLGISELVVGLVLVAGGTSLPELATSMVAALRGERDIAVGNVIGSNIFNILCIVGIVGVVAPGGIPVSPAVIAFDMPVMIATSIICLPILLSGFRIARGEGAILLIAYAAYASYLLLNAQKHDALPMVSWVLVAFVLPLLAFGIIAPLVWQYLPEMRARSSRR